jgi:uncharacterized membrane protein YgaE (UPF0421/DUF939 family)
MLQLPQLFYLPVTIDQIVTVKEEQPQQEEDKDKKILVFQKRNCLFQPLVHHEEVSLAKLIKKQNKNSTGIPVLFSVS